jgi:ABC-type phosphate/phosphonate transport system substrate-binding protein
MAWYNHMFTVHTECVALQKSSPYYGGVITTLKTNTHINTLVDLLDQRIAAESIYSLGGCLMQAQLMMSMGYSFLNDPSELIFTSSMDKALSHVMHNLSDVAFVRSGVLENCHALGNIDIDDWKVVHPVANFVDGVEFPFLISTQLVPEWSLSALLSLPLDVGAT